MDLEGAALLTRALATLLKQISDLTSSLRQGEEPGLSVDERIGRLVHLAELSLQATLLLEKHLALTDETVSLLDQKVSLLDQSLTLTDKQALKTLELLDLVRGVADDAAPLQTRTIRALVSLTERVETLEQAAGHNSSSEAAERGDSEP